MHRSPTSTDPQDLLRWFDMRKCARFEQDVKYLVTTPNMDFIPEPFVGRVKVSMRRDHRYGPVDPIQWPQMCSRTFEYLCAVRRRVPASDRLASIWWDPQEVDFRIQEGAMFKTLGFFRPSAIRPLEHLVHELSSAIRQRPEPVDRRLQWLEAAMRHACERLRRFPCTYRDAVTQVRETQRYWLMSQAFVDYEDSVVPAQLSGPNPVQPEFMGSFTTDPGIVQKLYAAGVPVWWIRSEISVQGLTLENVTEFLSPTAICTQFGPAQGHVLYSGLSGPDHIAATARGGHTYEDVSTAPLLAVHEDAGYLPPAAQAAYKKGHLTGASSEASGSHSQVGPSRTAPSRRQQAKVPYDKGRPHPSQVRGRNKFEPFVHEWITPPVDAWKWALSQVDISQPALRQGKWGLWIPEPATLVGPKPERRDRYFMTWLRLRPAWLYLLRHSTARVTSVPTQWWRDVLYGPGTRNDTKESMTTKRWQSIQSVFGSAFEQASWDDSLAYAHWHGFHLREINYALCPAILWELAELGFRHELLALDRFLVPYRDEPGREVEREELLRRVFPDDDIYTVVELPREPSGLNHPQPYRRVPWLEALRRVLLRWPACPQIIAEQSVLHSMPEPEIADVEKQMTMFYVNTFFQCSGRAPIVPHTLPPTHTYANPTDELDSDDTDSS